MNKVGIVLLSSTKSKEDTLEYLKSRTVRMQCGLQEMLVNHDNNVDPVPFAGKRELENASKEIQAVAKLKKKTVRNKILSTLFLVDADEIKEENFDCLSKDWSIYEAGTVTYTIKTDVAELCFLFPYNKIIDNTIVEVTSPSKSTVTNPVNGILNDEAGLFSTAFEICSKLSEGVDIAETAYDIINSLFGSEQPDWNTMRQDFENIVKSQLDQTIINMANDAVGAVWYWFTTDYPALPPEGLDPQLDSRVQEVENSLSTLSDPQYQISGFFDYLNAANMNLLLIRERYRIAQTPADKNCYANEYKANAQKLGQQIIASLAVIKNNRYSQITGVVPWTNTTCVPTNTGCVCHQSTGYEFTDNWTGYHQSFTDSQNCCSTTSSEPDAYNAYNAYMAQVNSDWDATYSAAQNTGSMMQSLTLPSM